MTIDRRLMPAIAVLEEELRAIELKAVDLRFAIGHLRGRCDASMTRSPNTVTCGC